MEKISIINTLKNKRNSLYFWLNKSLEGKHWALKIMFISLFLSLLLAFPSYEIMGQQLSKGRSQDLALQIQDLVLFWRNGQASNRMFRITVPVIAKLLGLNLIGTYILQFVSGVLIFLLTALIIERETKSRLISFFVTVLVGAIYAGISGFVETRLYFDSVALLFLLGAMFFRNPFMIGSFSLLAGFTDERAVVAAGFVFIWWAIQAKSNKPEIKAFFNKQSIAVVISVLIYLMIRMLIMRSFNVISYTELQNEFRLFDQINNGPMGIWTGLEGGWLIVGLALVTLLVKKRWVTLLAVLIIGLTQIIVALSVVDITRSMAYLLPLLFLSVAILNKETNDDYVNLSFYSALISLCLLTYYAGGKSSVWLYYPFPVQVIRWFTQH